jgi:hypothetical protein
MTVGSAAEPGLTSATAPVPDGAAGSTSAQLLLERPAAPAAPMEADKEVAPPFRVSPDETGQQMETEEPFETVKEEEEEGEEGEENEATGGQPKVSVQPGSSAAFKRISRAREVLTSDDERRQYDLSQKGSSEDTKWAASLIEEARAELAKHQAQQQAAAQKTVKNLPAAVLQLKDPRLAVRKKAVKTLGKLEPAVEQSIVQQFESAVQEFESAARKRKRVADEGSSPG